MMRTILTILLITVLATQSASAATIYLKDKTRIENVKILEELPDGFRVERKGETYGLPYSEVISKASIFCIINDKGEIKYPPSLAVTLGGVNASSLSPQELQAAMFQEQLRSTEKANSHLEAILIAGLVVSLVTTIVIFSTK